MKPAINISKVTPPRLHQIIDRPRLVERLEENNDKRLILIMGQAAQGKSTLAASYIKQSSTPAAWVNLRKDDSDPVNLFFSTVYALQYTFKGMDLSPLLNYPSISMGPRLETPLYREWANAIFECILDPVKIVLDGLDSLTPKAPSYGFLQVMLEELPQHFHFFMLSRNMPDLDIEGLKVKREAHILTNSELAFTQKEVSAFFKETRGMSLRSEQIKRIHTFTEGWIGGVILLSETLDRLPEEAREKYISEEIPDQFRREVFQYFGEEILSSHPALLQDFLIKSSIFDSVDPEFMKDFVEMENAEAILQESAKKNLFIEARYSEEKGWQFRYHPLFRGFLQAKFKSGTGEEERSHLLLKAGSLYEQRGEFERSIKCYLEAKAYDEATSLIKIVGMDLLNAGRKGDLSYLLEAFPKEMVQKNPWLLFYISMTKRFSETGKNISRLKDALTLFEKQKDISGQLLSLAFMIEASIFGGNDIIPLSSILEQSDIILDTLPSDQYVFEKAILYFQTGLGHAMRGGNLRRSLSASQNAYLFSLSLGNLALQISASANALLALSFLGKFYEAEKLCKDIEKLLNKCVYQEIRLIYSINLSAFLIIKGELKRAELLIQSAKKDAEKYGLIYCYPVILLYELILRPHLGEYEEAEKIANQLIDLVSALNNIFLKGAALMQLGMSYYCKEDYQKAEDCLDQSRKILLSDRAYSASHLGVSKIIKGLVSIHLDKYEIADKEFSDIFLVNEEQNSDLVTFHIHLATAILKWHQGDIDKTILNLCKGFKVAEDHGYYHVLWISKKDFCNACCLVLELNVKEVKNYATHLLSTHLSTYAELELEKLSLHPNVGVRENIRFIRKSIHRLRVPVVRINVLGGFQVLLGDAHLQDNKWQRTQPKALLKSIITHGSKGVSTDLVIDDLWPEIESRGNNFKVVLHRLRKSLEPKMDKTFGSSYIHLKENKLYLDEELVDLDVDRFLDLFTKGETNERAGDIKGALLHYRKAIDLYNGDFLPEDLYVPLIEQKREELRRRYLDLLLKTARIYEYRRALSKAISYYRRAIQTDPLLESACQRLMILFSDKGKRNEALRVYEECKKALKNELDSDPEQLTTAIYSKILG